MDYLHCDINDVDCLIGKEKEELTTAFLKTNDFMHPTCRDWCTTMPAVDGKVLLAGVGVMHE